MGDVPGAARDGEGEHGGPSRLNKVRQGDGDGTPIEDVAVSRAERDTVLAGTFDQRLSHDLGNDLDPAPGRFEIFGKHMSALELCSERRGQFPSKSNGSKARLLEVGGEDHWARDGAMEWQHVQRRTDDDAWTNAAAIHLFCSAAIDQPRGCAGSTHAQQGQFDPVFRNDSLDGRCIIRLHRQCEDGNVAPRRARWQMRGLRREDKNLLAEPGG